MSASRSQLDVPSAGPSRSVLGAAPVEDVSIEPPLTWRDAPWVMTTYFAEGVPFYLVHQVSTQVFVSLGMKPSAVGLTALYGLAWNLKFIMGPIIDGVGTLRRWVIGIQILLIAAIAALAAFTSAGQEHMLAWAFAVVAVVAATQDVAVDGFYLAGLQPRDQAAFSGLRIAAYRFAMMGTTGFLVLFAGLVSFRAAFGVAAVVFALLVVIHHRALPRVDEIRRDRPKRPEFVAAALTFLSKEKAAYTIAFLLFCKAGDALLFAMNTSFLDHLGFDTTMRGGVQGVVGTICSIGGAIAGGLYISRRGLRATLFPMVGLQAAAIALYVVLAAWKMPVPVICVFTALEQLAAGIGTAALSVFVLERARGDHKAAHFAVATSLATVGMTVFGSVSGFLVEWVGYTACFAIALALAVPGVVLARFVPKSS